MAGASPTAPIADMVRPARQWNVVDSHRNRRITVQTPMTFSGPAVGHRLLRTDADPGGTTPISTVNSPNS